MPMTNHPFGGKEMQRMAESSSDPEIVAAGTPELVTVGLRKPYERPRIISREPLEAMAATCPTTGRGKANTSVCGIARS